jgi:hypothetical protein
LKDFIYVAGSFNDWKPTSAYSMKRPDIRKFWLELTGLTSGVNYLSILGREKQRQLLIPRIGKTSDPYSTLVLSPYDDGGIPAATYPNMPIQ